MALQHLYQPFEIEHYTTNQCPIKRHSHTFFELAYIIDGRGEYFINQNRFNYGPGNLFLLMPMENHYTVVVETTSFLFIRFNDVYLNAQKGKDKQGELGRWIQKLEYIFQNANYMLGCIIRNKKDKSLVRVICEAIKDEYVDKDEFHKEVVQQLINTLLTVVARNISLQREEKTGIQSGSILEVLRYIQNNIYNTDMLRAERVAEEFNLSPNYLSEYFKKNAGISLKQYIINYRLSLAEVRLLHSDMRVSEIAFELGFNDEGHLSKTFKKYKGVSPVEFRKSHVEFAEA